MAALDPSSERDSKTKRWCWEEVMKQLRYRYAVELDGGKRPILRRIAAQDTPANVPMVLCISGVVEVNGGYMLEVTDGWYRLKAEIDEPLQRAVKKGVIRRGRKIAVSGARVSVCSIRLQGTLGLINLQAGVAKTGTCRDTGGE